MKKGQRVGAVLSPDDDPIYFFGFGKYIGMSFPEEAEGEISEVAKSTNTKVPKIKLDDGNIIYGCECFYGTEEDVKDLLKNKDNIKQIDIIRLRKQFLAHIFN